MDGPGGPLARLSATSCVRGGGWGRSLEFDPATAAWRHSAGPVKQPREHAGVEQVEELVAVEEVTSG